MANVAAFYEGEEDKAQQKVWVQELVQALSPGDDAAYVNFLGDEGAGRVRDAYPGATWERLRQVKAKYDPENLFRINQNVPPADGGQ
jgi:FAD/FMN-containing dehydrogenase